MPGEDDMLSLMQDCSTLELFEREKILCAFRYERRVSSDYIWQNGDWSLRNEIRT